MAAKLKARFLSWARPRFQDHTSHLKTGRGKSEKRGGGHTNKCLSELPKTSSERP